MIDLIKSDNAKVKKDMCAEHHKHKNMFCNDCKVYACCKCFVKNESHFGHEFITKDDRKQFEKNVKKYERYIKLVSEEIAN